MYRRRYSLHLRRGIPFLRATDSHKVRFAPRLSFPRPLEQVKHPSSVTHPAGPKMAKHPLIPGTSDKHTRVTIYYRVQTADIRSSSFLSPSFKPCGPSCMLDTLLRPLPACGVMGSSLLCRHLHPSEQELHPNDLLSTDERYCCRAAV